MPSTVPAAHTAQPTIHDLEEIIVSQDMIKRRVKTLGAEISAEVAHLVAQTDTVAAEDVDGIRDSATRLLGHVIKHRQRGADLVYEAYQMDIGGLD